MHKIRLFQEKQEHQMERKKKVLNSTMTTSTTMDRSQACRSLLPHPSRKHICNRLVHTVNYQIPFTITKNYNQLKTMHGYMFHSLH
jgi:hypothetical protein